MKLGVIICLIFEHLHIIKLSNEMEISELDPVILLPATDNTHKHKHAQNQTRTLHKHTDTRL